MNLNLLGASNKEIRSPFISLFYGWSAYFILLNCLSSSDPPLSHLDFSKNCVLFVKASMDQVDIIQIA